MMFSQSYLLYSSRNPSLLSSPTDTDFIQSVILSCLNYCKSFLRNLNFPMVLFCSSPSSTLWQEWLQNADWDIILVLSALYLLNHVVSQLRDGAKRIEMESMGDFSGKYFPAFSWKNAPLYFLHCLLSPIYSVYSSVIAPITLAHTVCTHAFTFQCEVTLLKARTVQQTMLMPCPMSPLLSLSSPAATADNSCAPWHLLSSCEGFLLCQGDLHSSLGMPKV